MSKTRLDRLLDKEHPTKEDALEIVKLIEEKENPSEEELGYLKIAKILLKAMEEQEPKSKPLTEEEKDKILSIVKEHLLFDQSRNVLEANFQWHFSDKETQDLLRRFFYE